MSRKLKNINTSALRNKLKIPEQNKASVGNVSWQDWIGFWNILHRLHFCPDCDCFIEGYDFRVSCISLQLLHNNITSESTCQETCFKYSLPLWCHMFVTTNLGHPTEIYTGSGRKQDSSNCWQFSLASHSPHHQFSFTFLDIKIVSSETVFLILSIYFSLQTFNSIVLQNFWLWKTMRY